MKALSCERECGGDVDLRVIQTQLGEKPFAGK